MEDKGFVPRLERLLVAVDDSKNARLASRLAGLIAGMRSIPITVVHLKQNGKNGNGRKKEPEKKLAIEEEAVQERTQRSEKRVTQAAAQIKMRQKSDEKIDTPVPVTTVEQDKPAPELIADEAKKGYDMMVIGVEKIGSGRKFHNQVTELAENFDGALVVVDARVEGTEIPVSKLELLVPINGTEPARRAAEVAITMARATRSTITALYVAQRGVMGAKRPRRTVKVRRQEEEILKDVAKLAASYGVEVRTAVHANVAPENAILKEAAKRRYDFLVLGVSRRPGDTLFFGETAATMLEKAKSSLVFVATGREP
jgi:nucleotide-binding universal stress UspA family protein